MNEQKFSNASSSANGASGGATPQLPQLPETYWRASNPLNAYPKLESDITVDVAIIGGGITGITTAYLLSQQGVKVALLEADVILNGTTGHTTAKVTAQHDLIYDELIRTIGEEQAKLYYDANKDALEMVRSLIRKHHIDCGYATEDAYIYAQWESSLAKLNSEALAYEKLGIAGEFVASIPLAVPSVGAVVMRDQARFHPLQYLAALLQPITEAGGLIYEHSTVIDIETGNGQDLKPVIVTKDGKRVTAGQVAVCTHFPIIDKHGFYFARLYAERSYVLAAKVKEAYPGGMYLSADNPKRSLRLADAPGGPLILIGGENHKTGQGICTMDYYESLLGFAERQFTLEAVPYRWSAQDLITLDNIPYIGSATQGMPNIYIATGYKKWGMTSSTAAAQLLTDLMIGKENPYRELFSPHRFHADPSLKTLVVQNLDTARQLITGKLESVRRKPEELENGEGAVVMVDGKRAGAFKDDQGTLYLVDTTCTHMGCEVEWNDGEQSWDCPCHGSRFSYEGLVLEGPAKEPLKQLKQLSKQTN